MTSSNELLKRLTDPETAPHLEIKPRNLEVEDGDLWDDLFDIIVQTWENDNKEIFQKSFDITAWNDDFIQLGFSSSALSAFHGILQTGYTVFGHEVVDMILEYETVGDIALLMVWGDVMDYSRRHCTNESSGQKGNEASSSAAATSSSEQKSASTQGTSLPSTIPNEREEDQYDDPSQQHLDGATEKDYADNLTTHPRWLDELHISARDRGIQLVFTNSDVIQSSSNVPKFVEWTPTTQNTPAYHGCTVEEESFVGIFQSFTSYGVQARATRRGYYSVTPASYWTNSIQYARIWPTMKASLRNWRKMEQIPSPSLLIVVSEPNIMENGLIKTVIPQAETVKAAEVCHSYSPLLTSQQYTTACKDLRNVVRQKHPDFPGIETSDFIVAPLPAHTIRTMQNSYLGSAINVLTTISCISVLTAASPKAVENMNSHIKSIIILGWGEGVLGDTEQANFGTAGIREGETSYRGE